MCDKEYGWASVAPTEQEDLFAECEPSPTSASGAAAVVPVAPQPLAYTTVPAGHEHYIVPARPSCQHYGDLVAVGEYVIWVGGATFLQPSDLAEIDILVPLLDTFMPFGFRGRYQVLALPLQDYGGVPRNWRSGVEDVIRELQAGRRVLAFCQGGHGRTGTLLASLVALLESRTKTPDPIKAVRERYCEHAVETREQAKAIFDLRGDTLPLRYTKEFPVGIRRTYRTGKKGKHNKFFQNLSKRGP